MSVPQQPVNLFAVAVSGRTLTPIGNIAINDLRPRTPTGALTFTGIVNGAQFDIYALAQPSTRYTLLALASGTSVAGRTDVLLVGSAYDYPSTGGIQWVPLMGGGQDAYLYLASDGLHIRPFGGLGYSQVILDSPGRTNDLVLWSSSTFTHIFNNGTFGTTNEMDIVAGGILYLAGGGISVFATGANNLNLAAQSGAVTLQSNGSGNATVGTFSGIYYQEANSHQFMSGNGGTQYGYLDVSQLHHNTLLSAPTKSFVIPHPTRPGYVLEHNAVEMPEPCVKYRGIVTLDATGKAPLPLPAYASVLIDPTKITVQLTAVGATPFACSYQYAGMLIHGAANGTVAWEATGMRLDVQPTAVAYPAPPDYDESAFPYPARINAMRDTVGAAHLSTTPLAKTRVAALEDN